MQEIFIIDSNMYNDKKWTDGYKDAKHKAMIFQTDHVS